MTPKEIRQLEGTLIQRGYKYLNEGRHRKGFLSPNKKWVVKVPKTCARLAGIQDNWSEYHTFKRARPAIRARLARCRLFKGEILVMENCVLPIYVGVTSQNGLEELIVVRLDIIVKGIWLLTIMPNL